MTQELASGSAGEPPPEPSLMASFEVEAQEAQVPAQDQDREGAQPPVQAEPPTPALPEPAPAEGVVKKTGRLIKGAVMATSELIVKTEEKVAEQWSRATGNALQFSGGFSWRKSEDGSTEVVRRWTAPMKAVKPRRRRWVWLAVGAGVLVAAGLGVWLATRPKPETPEGEQEPLF